MRHKYRITNLMDQETDLSNTKCSLILLVKILNILYNPI